MPGEELNPVLTVRIKRDAESSPVTAFPDPSALATKSMCVSTDPIGRTLPADAATNESPAEAFPL